MVKITIQTINCVHKKKIFQQSKNISQMNVKKEKNSRNFSHIQKLKNIFRVYSATALSKEKSMEIFLTRNANLMELDSNSMTDF